MGPATPARAIWISSSIRGVFSPFVADEVDTTYEPMIPSKPSEDTIAARQMLERIRAEYLEMPGMRLTAEQVQRLCGVDASLCQLVMDSLVARKFLCLHPDGTYVRMTVDSVRPRPLEAELSPARLVSSRRAS